MTNPFESQDGDFVVLKNDEGQYSLWPSFREAPVGWTIVGPRGTRVECLTWIDQVWTDMRPQSLIRQMSGVDASGEKNTIN